MAVIMYVPITQIFNLILLLCIQSVSSFFLRFVYIDFKVTYLLTYINFKKIQNSLLKIYQTRHPDINANAYTAFGVLAFIIFIGVIGVLHSDFYFWMFFTSLHCISCLVLSFQVRKI